MKSHQELQNQLNELIRIGSDIVARQLTKASAGNLSVRDPDREDVMLITGTGTWLDDLGQSSFVRMSLSGEILEGELQPSSEWRMHAEIYKMRKDAASVIHAHPKYSVLLDAINREIRFFTLDHISYVRSYGASPFAPNASDQLASGVAGNFRTHDVVIMSHHGVVTCGETPKWAYRKLLNMEDSAEMTYRALMLGDKDSGFPKDQTLSVHN